MSASPKPKLLLLIDVGALAALFGVLFANSNSESPYAPVTSFVGCYSNRTNRLALGANGKLTVNGTVAGSYKILKPVGGKHGFLVEASGLTLVGGWEAPLSVTPGNDGFFWPISGEALDIISPDIEATLAKKPHSTC